MGMFEEFREPGWNTYYSHRPTPVEFDVKTAVVAYLAAVLVAAVLMIFLGTRGHERWTTLFRLLLSLHTGVVIIVCNVSQSWQVGHVHSHCQYSMEIANGLHADVGLHIGLKSLNITLRGNTSALRKSVRIGYNEEFSFDHVKDIKNNYRAALERGLPQPIVYSLEFFRVDDGGFLWHRAMRSAGHFTYIIFWTSLVSWFVTNILLCFEPVRGLAMMTLTGCLMVTGIIVYHCMQPTQPLVIHFEDGLLLPQYGWSFWLGFASGILAFLAGVCLLVLYARYPTATTRLLRISDSQHDDDDTGRQLYDYSPGPLKIDTPFSRRTNRLACRRTTDATSARGLSNDAFLLDDLPFSDCSRCPISGHVDHVEMSDLHHQTDDDEDQTDTSHPRSELCASQSRTNGSSRSSTGPVDDIRFEAHHHASRNTTFVVIEHAASTASDVNEQLTAEVKRLSEICRSTAAQRSTSLPSIPTLTSAQYRCYSTQ